jgi:hypothetical protein
LQIWQLLTALLAFLELKRSHAFYTLFLFWISRENPQQRVCLLIFGSLSLVLFWLLTREWGVLWKGRFTKYRVLLADPLFFPWACTRAKYTPDPRVGHLLLGSPPWQGEFVPGWNSHVLSVCGCDNDDYLWKHTCNNFCNVLVFIFCIQWNGNTAFATFLLCHFLWT